MSEAPVEQSVESNEPQGGEQGDPADRPLGESGGKALQVEREARKAAEDKLAELAGMSKGEVKRFVTEARENARRIAELEQANESALEKAQREAKEAREQTEQVPQRVAEQLRDHLVSLHGISDEHRDLYLTSNDPETLLKQAAGLVNRTPAAPKPDPSQGGKGNTAKGSTADQFAAAISDALN